MKPFLFFLFLILTGCQNQPKITVFTGNAMTIDYRIIVGENLNEEQKKLAESIIKSTFSEIDRVYNKWNPNSEISALNRTQANISSPISPELEKFLQTTEEIVIISSGRFDPTIEPLQQLWKTKLAQGTVPSDEEINAILPAIGWNKIHFGNDTFSKDYDLASLDLGGIAKGLCVDLQVEHLNEAGFHDVYVEWGGEIRGSGKHPDNRPWNIFISYLGDRDPNHAIAHVSLNNQAIATSGDYLQQWTANDGTTYFHILDPTTGKPLVMTGNNIASASVLAPNCALADGLATVAMMFPSIEEASAWLERVKMRYPTIQYWLVTRK